MNTKEVFLTVLCNNNCNSHKKDKAHPSVKASIYVKIPGLAFHETVATELSEFGRWTVTHVKSGYRVGPLFNTRRQCMEYIRYITDLLDWGQESEDVKKSYNKLSDRAKSEINRFP